MATEKSDYPLLSLRAMFYLVTPNETSFERVEEVPDYLQDKGIPCFAMFIIVECIILKIQGKKLPRFNDGLNSMAHGMLSGMTPLLIRPIELLIYVWIYENYRLVTIPWNSTWGWLLGWICIDFIYYWFHRLSHECNIIWASHQVHHSSEDYNITTSLRQSIWQKYYNMILHFPLALFLHPSIFYLHYQLNLLYQFWIHTEVINSIGPLEYILNTPSHHRVHHGRNPYCIDKNYGGMLIIWDRIFKTFAAEKEKVIYGLVHPNQFWNPLQGQIFHYLYIFDLVKSHKGWANKLSAIFKGPGWEPGKPWTGLTSDLPEVEQPVRQYDSALPTWANIYVSLHFVIIIVTYGVISPYKEQLDPLMGLAFATFFVGSVTIFGALFDHGKYSTILEFIRCQLCLGLLFYFKSEAIFQELYLSGVTIIFILSVALWGTLTYRQYQFQVVTATKKDT